MNRSDYKGVIWHDEDRGSGPFILRQSGTSNFVIEINYHTIYYSRWGNPRQSVVFGEGWDNPKALSYQTMEEAIEAGRRVFEIEGIYVQVETKK
tara:strand:- start:783 stop:1064 length:282 start_codon:yes stop_codon:yes gene_type:complete